MVASEKMRQRKGFAERLHRVLDDFAQEGCPGRDERGRQTWLWKRLFAGRRELVSRNQIRKYLTGTDLPEMANFLIVCERLGVSPIRLLPDSDGNADPLLDHVHRIWRDLDPEARALVLSAAQLAAKATSSLAGKTAVPNYERVPVREPRTGS